MRRLILCLSATLALVTTACGGGGSDENPKQASDVKGAGSQLVGIFKIVGGICDATGPVTKGSSFRMINPGGKLGEGPFIQNGDSPCGDKTFSPVLPGTDGGLRTGAYQPEASPPFDDKGNGTTSTMSKPTSFFGVAFSMATNRKDPQTGQSAPTPSIVGQDGKLSGDLSAFAASWNKQHFNQGAPKPGGARPGLTTGPTGTYDAATETYTLDWSSQIVGGPFNNFTGVWHLEGTFEPKG
jgi:hypothetical protein